VTGRLGAASIPRPAIAFGWAPFELGGSAIVGRALERNYAV
jgi:hypothetical protein